MECPLRTKNTFTKLKTVGVSSFLGQLGLIIDPHSKKQTNETKRLNDPSGPENINCIVVKYGDTFYGRHTALAPAVVKRKY